MQKIKIGLSGFLACLFILALSSGLRADTYIDQIDIPKLSEPEMPKIETVTLDNGIKVYLVEDHKLPLVRARIRFAAGSFLDPLDKVGLGSIVGTVMRTGGTENMTGDEIDEKLESVGASVETSIGRTSGNASMNILTDYVDMGLGILADVVRRPVFDEDKIDLAKTEERSSISRRNDDAWQICIREARKLIYGEDSPYARQTEYATIDAISRDDLVNFQKKYISPENVMIAVWGDFKKDDMIKKIQDYFGDWKTGSGPVPPLPKVEYTYESGVYYIDKKNINQSKILIGHIGGLVSDDDYYSRIIMNDILGASFGSRLFNEVRSKQGLAYAVGGSYTSNIPYKGMFYNYCFTKSETTVQAIKSIIEEIKRMQVDEPTPQELERGKDSYLNSFVFNFEDKADIIGRMMTYDFYGYPRDFIFQEKSKVEQVTADDVLAAAKANLHPNALKIVVVGNADEFDGSLAEFGKVDTIDVSIPTGESNEELAVTDEMLSQGKALMEKAAKALGGVQNFEEIKTVSTKSTVNLITPQGEFALESETISDLPDKMRNVMVTPMGEMISVQNGDKMWVKQGPQVIEGTPDQIEDTRREEFRNPIMTIKGLNGPNYQFIYLGPDEINGKKVELIQIQNPDASMKYKLALDAETYLPVARMYFGQTMMGPANLTAYLDDYREIGQLKVPFSVNIEADGNPVANIVFTDYAVNIPTDDTMFTRPE